MVVVATVVWAAPATVVVAVQVVPVAQAALTTSRVVVVNHGMAEPAASLEPVLLLVAIPVVRGLS